MKATQTDRHTKLTQFSFLLAVIFQIRQIDLLNFLIHSFQLLWRVACRQFGRHKVGHTIVATHQAHAVGAAMKAGLRWEMLAAGRRGTTHLVGIKLKLGAVAK